MALKLMYITNKEDIAKIAEYSGVDWIFIDLEINGKYERQGHLDTVISRHSIEDIKKIKNVLTESKLLVRINPVYNESKEEIDRVIEYGADIIMLPFFKTKEEVETFVEYVNYRVETCLLCETPEAVENIDSILSVKGIDYIHIGLNDLHLGYNMKFMFELLSNGTVEMLCNKFKAKGVPYGYGGIAQLGEGTLPAEYILAEHYRLGSTMVILSRSFCNINKIEDISKIEDVFRTGISRVREYEHRLVNEKSSFFQENHKTVCDKVKEIVYFITK